MTFGKSLFSKFFLSAAALIGITVVGLDLYITNYLTQREMTQVRERLQLSASLAALDLNRLEATTTLDRWVAEIAMRSQSRLTLIDTAGRVLADSESDAASMENHAQRPEFQQALRGTPGEDLRRSATLNQDFLYYAIPVQRAGHAAGPVASLRLATPIERVTRATTEIRWRLAGTSLLVLTAALGLAWIMSRRFSTRVEHLEAFAGRVADRQPTEALKVDSLDELGSLGNSLNRMSSQLSGFVEKLENESRSRDTILSSMAEGVLAVDSGMRLTFCNPAFARAMGIAYPVAGHPLLAGLVSDTALLGLLAKVIETNKASNDQLRLAEPGARLFIVHAVPFGPSNAAIGPNGALAIFHDITDIERLERVRRDFVSNASHELRTPISAIQGYVETLLDGALEDPSHNRRFLETISSNAIRLKNITADLLILSEIEAGSAQLNEVFPLRSAVESAIRTSAPEAVARRISLAQEEVPEVQILGSRLRLEQALINLITNGVKFNEPGGSVSVTAASVGSAPDAAAVEIRVTDTGIGIPPQDLPRIFERFYRVDKARSRDVGGTGLGLSIVKHAVEAMGGTITVDSKLERGSVFTITLPVVIPQAA